MGEDAKQQMREYFEILFTKSEMDKIFRDEGMTKNARINGFQLWLLTRKAKSDNNTMIEYSQTADPTSSISYFLPKISGSRHDSKFFCSRHSEHSPP